MIRALVMTHGQIGTELVRVVEMILGPIEGLDASSNSGLSAEDITSQVEAWLAPVVGDEQEAPERAPTLILVDDYGGSCAHAAQLACGDRPDSAVLSGVNLAMLLGFVTWRDSSDFNDLVHRLVQKGREAITIVGNR